jgi:soluble lytic murein transglycosylase-like protein
MLTKTKIDYVVLGTLSLLLTTHQTQAAPSSNISSPYQLNAVPGNAAPAKIMHSVDSLPNFQPNQAPKMYQLEYKYRSQNKLLKTKSAQVDSDVDKEQTMQAVSPPLPITTEIALAEQPFSNEIALAANAVSLDPSLVHAVIYVESRYRHNAISAKGAVGLMQVLPDTAARYGLRGTVHSPKGNIKAGTLYLRDLMVMFDNRLDLVLAAYNAGEGAVKKYARQIPPYPETRHYVKAVMAKYALNTEGSEWQTTNSNAHSAKQETKEADLLIKTHRPTEYMTGTNLVISTEAFKLNR